MEAPPNKTQQHIIHTLKGLGQGMDHLQEVRVALKAAATVSGKLLVLQQYWLPRHGRD